MLPFGRSPLVLAALCALLLPACTTTSAGGRSAGSRAVLRVGTLIEPNSLNPLVGTITIESRIANLIFDGLVRIDDHGRPVPDLAVTVPSSANGGISRDGRTVTYHLVPAARWQDGKPLTARDVIFTWRAIMNPRNNVQTRDGYDQIASIDAVGAHAVRIHFREPFAPAVYLFAAENRGAILPEHVLAGFADLNRVPFNRAPMGSGPYILREWRHGDRLLFDANPSYFRAVAKIPHIEIRVLPDTNTELTQLRTHEIDATSDLDPNQLPVLRGVAGVSTTIVSTNGYRHVTFNTRQPPLDDVNVRRALCYALDADAIYRKTYLGVGERAPADQNPGSGWADPSLRYYPHDPRQASAMLEHAGWRRGPDGILTRNGQRFSISLVSVAGAKANEAVEVALQDAWHAIGVETVIKNFPGTTLFAPSKAGGVVLGGKFDVALYSLYRDPDPNDMALMGPAAVPPNGFNASFYADPQMGRLQIEGIRTFDLARRHQIYNAIQRMIVENVPIYTLLWVPLIEAHDSRLHGVKPAPSSIDFWNITDWTIAG